MWFLKILSIGGIIAICSYLGNLKSKTFENRVIELRNVQTSLNMFKSKIEFTCEPIKDIFEEISQSVYQNADNIFINTVTYMRTRNATNAWYYAIENTKSDFNKEDKEMLKTMGKLLGRTDKTGQISEITLTENFLKSQIEKAETEKNKNVKLYRTLGTICGLGIGIIFM